MFLPFTMLMCSYSNIKCSLVEHNEKHIEINIVLHIIINILIIIFFHHFSTTLHLIPVLFSVDSSIIFAGGVINYIFLNSDSEGI